MLISTCPDARISQCDEPVVEQWTPGNRDEALGNAVCERPQPGTQSRRQDERFRLAH